MYRAAGENCNEERRYSPGNDRHARHRCEHLELRDVKDAVKEQENRRLYENDGDRIDNLGDVEI